MSPVDDTFISGSLDQTVRLWDTRTPNCRGLLNTHTAPIVTYESSGAVFAVGFNEFNKINLYDQNNFDKEPFDTFTLSDPSLKALTHPPREPFMTSLTFSNNGKFLLVGASGDAHYLLDAFDGVMLLKLQGHMGLERGKIPGANPGMMPSKGISGEEVSFTPDSRFVVSGSHDGKVVIWDVSDESKIKAMAESARKANQHPPTREPLAAIEAQPAPSRCVKFNPRFAMLATATTELAFWLPDTGGNDNDFDAKKLLGKMGLS